MIDALSMLNFANSNKDCIGKIVLNIAVIQLYSCMACLCITILTFLNTKRAMLVCDLYRHDEI